jgi:UDP-N-acetylglucosamine acyltransferase
MAEIHPSALVDPKAELADSVKVGPFCIVGPNVKLGENVDHHREQQ